MVLPNKGPPKLWVTGFGVVGQTGSAGGAQEEAP